MKARLIFVKGGKGSGHHGHSGLPKVHGGSKPGKGGLKVTLEGMKTDDYQKRGNSYPREDIPDRIDFWSSDMLMRVKFKNTFEDTAEKFVKGMLKKKGVSGNVKTIRTEQTGEFENDWVTVSVEFSGDSK